MGATHSLTQSSEAGTLNWNDVKTEQPNTKKNNGITIKKLDNGMEEIDIEINPLSDSENSVADISNVFQKLEEIASEEDENKGNDEQGSSPFISTELYKKIMQGGENDSSSPFISTEIYKKIMKGGAKSLDDSSSSSTSNSSDSSTSSSELMKALSEITVSSSDYPRKEQHKNQFKKHDSEVKYHSHKHEKKNEPTYGSSTSSIELKGYGFSETSSEIPDDNKKYFVGGNSTETPYNVNSSSIATSDINLISVDSVNGRRFINKN